MVARDSNAALGERPVKWSQPERRIEPTMFLSRFDEIADLQFLTFCAALASHSIKDMIGDGESAFRADVFPQVHSLDRNLVPFASFGNQLDGIISIDSKIVEGLPWRDLGLRFSRLPGYKFNHFLFKRYGSPLRPSGCHCLPKRTTRSVIQNKWTFR